MERGGQRDALMERSGGEKDAAASLQTAAAHKGDGLQVQRQTPKQSYGVLDADCITWVGKKKDPVWGWTD